MVVIEVYVRVSPLVHNVRARLTFVGRPGPSEVQIPQFTATVLVSDAGIISTSRWGVLGTLGGVSCDPTGGVDTRT